MQGRCSQEYAFSWTGVVLAGCTLRTILTFKLSLLPPYPHLAPRSYSKASIFVLVNLCLGWVGWVGQVGMTFVLDGEMVTASVGEEFRNTDAGR